MGIRLMMEVSMSAIPLRTDYDAAGVRGFARKVSDPDQVRSLLAIAAIYDGINRAEAETVGGMDRQSLCDWVYRFNADGPGQISHFSHQSDWIVCELQDVVAVDKIITGRRFGDLGK
jgi:hypothetical protein